MTTNIVPSLFGLTPQQVRQQQYEQDRQFAQQFAETQATPYAKERALLGATVGSALTRGVAGLFGLRTGEEQRAVAMDEALKTAVSSLPPEERGNRALIMSRLSEVFATNPNFQRESIEAAMQAATFAQEDMKVGAELGAKRAAMTKDLAAAAASLQDKKTTIEKLLIAKENATSPEAAKAIQAQIDKETQQSLPSIENEIVRLSTKKASGTITPEEEKQLDYLDNFKTKLAKSASTNISLNTEKSLSGKVGDIFAIELPAANAAADALMAVQDIKSAISSGKVLVGPGATVRQTLSQLAQVYAGGTNEQQLANTRSAIRGLADLALTARARLKGTGAISNYEQQTVEKATTGNIDDLTIPEIQVLTDVVERNAKSTYNDYTRKLKSVKDQDLINIYSPKPMPGTGGAVDDLVEKYRTKSKKGNP